MVLTGPEASTLAPLLAEGEVFTPSLPLPADFPAPMYAVSLGLLLWSDNARRRNGAVNWRALNALQLVTPSRRFLARRLGAAALVGLLFLASFPLLQQIQETSDHLSFLQGRQASLQERVQARRALIQRAMEERQRIEALEDRLNRLQVFLSTREGERQRALQSLTFVLGLKEEAKGLKFSIRVGEGPREAP